MSVSETLHKRRRSLQPQEVIENKEDIRLIWLNPTFADDEVSIQIQSRLLELNPACQIYSDSDQCIHLLKLLINEQIFIIISDTANEINFSELLDLRSVTDIFIFCSDQRNHQFPIHKDNRIVGTYTDFENLLKSIENKIHLNRKQSLRFTLFDQKQRSIRDLSKESASFLWYQLLIHILKELPHDEQSREDMLEKCTDYYRTNKREMKKIEQFRLTYTSEQAIEWYTDECFLYKLLNKALRTEDFQLLYAFRSFIIDLITQLQQESLKRKNNGTVMLYRGQQLSMDELNKIKQNIGILISMNGFFSTSRNIDVALAYAGKCQKSDNLQSILFQIEADLSLTSVIFADISGKSRMEDEQEVLFGLNTLFKINSVEFDSNLDTWNVCLITTEETSGKVQEYWASLKDQMNEYKPIIYFGRLLLIELGHTDRAEDYFTTLLRSLPVDHPDMPDVYNGMGHVHFLKNELDEALEFFELAYKMRQNQLPSDHPHILSSLDNMGNIYRLKGDFDMAFEFYTQASTILEQIYPGDHVRKARSIKGIGLMYQCKGEFDCAKTYLFDALEMYKRVLPAVHPEIARCLHCIASFYRDQDQMNLALGYYDRALNMKEQCLPLDHPDICECIIQIINTYKNKNELDRALEFCLDKIKHHQDHLDENHPNLIQIMMIAADLLKDKDTNKALNYYQRSLSILESLETAPDPQTINECLRKMIHLYKKCDKLTDTLQCHHKRVSLCRKTLPSNHINLAESLKELGACYQMMRNVPEAIRYLRESLSIYLANYGVDHPSVKELETDIAMYEGEMAVSE